MACEALAVLDCADDIDSWARRFARAGGASVDPVVPAGFEWRQALGDYHRLPGRIGYFHRALYQDRLPASVAARVPAPIPAAPPSPFHRALPAPHTLPAPSPGATPTRPT